MKILITLLGLCLSIGVQAQQYWTDVSLPNTKTVEGITYEEDRTLSLEWTQLRASLRGAAMEFTQPAANSETIIHLPFPDGELVAFRVVESPVMTPNVSARYPNIKAYKAYAIDRVGVTARFDISPNAFHAAVRTPEGRIYIDPLEGYKGHYRSFYVKKVKLSEELIQETSCGVSETDVEYFKAEEDEIAASKDYSKNASMPLDLRSYRFAITCTGEYAQRYGGTIASVLATYNTSVNRLNEIFENEMAIRFILVEQIDTLIFLDPDTDPYLSPRSAGTILGQNGNIINSRIGFNNYDVGHAYTLGCDDSGGVALLASACTPSKGNATSCFSSTNVSFMTARTVAHEVGHQFSATHTFHNCAGEFGTNARTAITAYEPGSGSTIMSYGGGCGDQSIQSNSDDYFHVASLEQMIRYSREGNGNNCPNIIPVGNQMPEVSLPYDRSYTIPASTPFELTAIGTDADDDALTYAWEQFDLEPLITDIQEPRQNAPLFRSIYPDPSPTRIFPSLETILRNRNDDTESLPTYTRTMDFRVTVRDNHPVAGAAVWTDYTLGVDSTAGPFIVTAPNQNEEWEVGSYQEITWDVANTDNARVNAQRVNIRLSIDGGRTYPFLLAEGTKNDGSDFVTIPNLPTNSARIKVEAADNVFFDITNRNFQIIEPTTAGFSFLPTPAYQEVCLPNAIAIDISTAAYLGFADSLQLSLENVPEGLNASFEQATILAGENTTLNINATDQGISELIALNLVATPIGNDTAESISRVLELDVVTNDFSGLMLMSPTNGTNGIVGITDFVWNDAPNADSYDFELATSPVFGETIIDVAEGITGSTYRPDVFLDENTIYYWRIRPNNQCGSADYLVPNVFQTVNVQCVSFEQDIPVPISGNGTPTVESVLNIESAGTITDLNISNLRGDYQPVRFLEVSLISPAGTQVILMRDTCGSTADIDMGFDDEAPDPISCPPTAQVPQRPSGSLADFDGEELQGEWKMQFKVLRAGFGSGGSIDRWTMESCGDIPVSAPFLVNNEVFELPPDSRSQIWTPVLLAEDEDNLDSEISYQLLSVPAHGTLYRNETPLNIGDSFTQQDINGYLISYEHNGDEATADKFDFVLLDTDGGWFGGEVFNITITEDATVNTEEVVALSSLSIYPNPTREQLTIDWQSQQAQAVEARLFDLNGQLVQTLTLQPNGFNQMDVQQLPNGIYILSVQEANERYLERVVVQH
jgi:subtilisin-like proprotein convertase family protein